MNSPILWTRNEELKKVIRYKENKICKPMLYTPDLWVHVNRVTWITKHICEHLNLDEDVTKKTTRRAMFHDDSEIVAWDIISAVKQNWNQEQKDDYAEKCKNAIPLLVNAYGEELWNDYGEILHEMESPQIEYFSNSDHISHAIVEYADKMDAFMEVTHELYSWSDGFLRNLKASYNFDTDWFNYVLTRVKRRKQKLEKLLWYTLTQEWFFALQQQENLNMTNIVSRWKAHTQDSVRKTSDNILYDTWKHLHFDNSDEKFISPLYTQSISQ